MPSEKRKRKGIKISRNVAVISAKLRVEFKKIKIKVEGPL
jgi:hypothetical protein